MKYHGLIFTNHAMQRMSERGLYHDKAWQTFTYPDKKYAGKEKDTTEFQKRFNNSWVTVIAKQNDRKEWLVLSAWITPPLPGTLDAKRRERYKKYQQSGWFGKLLLTLKSQLGL